MAGIKKSSCFRKMKALAAVPVMQIRQDANLSLVLQISATLLHIWRKLFKKKTTTICNCYVALDQQLAHSVYIYIVNRQAIYMQEASQLQFAWQILCVCFCPQVVSFLFSRKEWETFWQTSTWLTGLFQNQEKDGNISVRRISFGIKLSWKA